MSRSQRRTIFGIPAMVHTGMGIPFSLPCSFCIPAANKYPDLKIVLAAHAGGGIVSAEAQVAASAPAAIFILETSWCLRVDIEWMIDTIGADLAL